MLIDSGTNYKGCVATGKYLRKGSGAVTAANHDAPVTSLRVQSEVPASACYTCDSGSFADLLVLCVLGCHDKSDVATLDSS